MLLSESLFLSLAAGGLGILFALWGVDALLSAVPESLARVDARVLDPRTLAFAVLISTATGLAFGIAPAIALFLLSTDRQRALHPRTVAVWAGACLAGVAQYGLIWIRTVQGAPYLEARARGLKLGGATMRSPRPSHSNGMAPPST